MTVFVPRGRTCYYVYFRYPNASETKALYERSGVAKLAARIGVPLDPTRHDWSRGGMRSLEELAAELLIQSAATSERTIQTVRSA